MNIGIIIDVMTSWQVLVIIFVLLLFFPIVFFIASLDKKPVRIDKKVPEKASEEKNKDERDGKRDSRRDEPEREERE